jgi:hypothetical protein
MQIDTIRDGPSQRFHRETLHKGKPALVECVSILGQTFAIRRGPITILSLEDEWYDDVRDPDAVVEGLRRGQFGFRPDIFTFWQRIPEVEPTYPYAQEPEDLAVLPITSYEDWVRNSLRPRVRSQLRKSEKDGVSVRETQFDDEFIKGMTAIFNESPVRQGRPFWHYGKDFETVKRQFSRFLHRERMIGAYFEDHLIGFVMLGNAGRYGITGQIISSLAHRDKAPNIALIAKAVQVCVQSELQHLVYFHWSDDSLGEFKRRCGFQRTSVPRYYVPLTPVGHLALRLGAHRGLAAMIPESARSRLKEVRSWWYRRGES